MYYKFVKDFSKWNFSRHQSRCYAIQLVFCKETTSAYQMYINSHDINTLLHELTPIHCIFQHFVVLVLVIILSSYYYVKLGQENMCVC